jgi:hypothetical protein
MVGLWGWTNAGFARRGGSLACLRFHPGPVGDGRGICPAPAEPAGVVLDPFTRARQPAAWSDVDAARMPRFFAPERQRLTAPRDPPKGKWKLGVGAMKPRCASAASSASDTSSFGTHALSCLAKAAQLSMPPATTRAIDATITTPEPALIAASLRRRIGAGSTFD